MTTLADGKMLPNALYQSAVVSGIASGYVRLVKMAMCVSPPPPPPPQARLHTP